VIRRDAIFNESDFPCDSEVSDGVTINDHEKGMVCEENGEPVEQPELEYQFGMELMNMYVDTAFLGGGQIGEPQSVEEALESRLSKSWKEVADSEYQSLIENEIWELVELFNGWKPVGCKWVLRLNVEVMEKLNDIKPD